MSRRHTAVPFCLSVVMLLLSLCPQGRAQCGGPTCHELTGPISDGAGGPFLSGHTYVININSSVPTGTTLTIQPGAIVKFKAWFFGINGTLLAQGSAGQPIVFTSFLDDSVGGDTNGDGGATSPAAKDWGSIAFLLGSGASVVEHALVRYSGRFNNAGVSLHTAGVTLDHVTLVDTGNIPGIDMNGVRALVSNCHFANVKSPIVNLNANDLDDLTDNTGAASNGDNAIWLQGNSSTLNVTGNTTWGAANMVNGTGGVVINRNLEVPLGATMNWQPGLVLKFDATRGFSVKGTLNALGSAAHPIVATSIHDDAFGSDVSTGSPAPGDWRNVQLAQGAQPAQLRHMVLRYGGQQNTGMLRVDAAATVEGCLLEKSSSAGIYVGSIVPPQVSNCVFLDNAAEPITAVPLQALTNFSGNLAMGNGAGDAIVLGGGTLSVPATLNTAAAFNGTGAYVLQGSTQVGAGGVLSVQPGVIFKGKTGSELRAVSGGKLLIGGAGAPVVFTSIHDDSHGGDLNANGAATMPAPGDWKGVAAVFADDSSVIDNVLVRYAGNNAIALVETDLTLSNTVVEFSSGTALFGFTQSFPTVTGCAFNHGGGAKPVAGFQLTALANFSANTATGNAGGNSLAIDGSSIAGDALLIKPNTLNDDGVLVVTGFLSFDNSSTFTLGPGMVLKFEGDAQLVIGKTLLAQGTQQQPVVLTSYDDDYAGDTNGDGGAPSQGTPGSWRGLALNLVSTGSVLTYTSVRNAGLFDTPSVKVSGGVATFDHVTVERGTAVAFLADGGLPVVTNCAFNTHLRPVQLNHMEQLLGFSTNTAGGNTQHDSLVLAGQGAHPAGGWKFTRERTLNASGLLRLNFSPNISNAQTLTVGPGMVLKWNSPDRQLQVSGGTLLVQGTESEPVVMTSRHDDDFGGADNDPTAPAPGDWSGLRFVGASSASLVEHAIIRYAGFGGSASVDLQNSSPSFCFVHIEFGAGPGIDTHGNSAPLLKNVSIDDNAGDPILGITWNVLANLKGITAMGNGSDLDTVVIESPLVVGHVTIEQENLFGPCIVVRATPNTSTANTLNFGRGLVVKVDGANVALRVRDVLATGQEKTVFTSIHDDSWAGDTNGNGGATQPQPGDWIGLTNVAASGPPHLDGEIQHALVRYAGAPLTGTDPAGLFGYQVLSARVEFSAGGGVIAEDCFNTIAFDNAGIGLLVENVAANCTSVRNGELGIRARSARYCISWHNGPTLSENFFEVPGPIIGCSACAASTIYSIGTNLGLSPPVQGAPGFFGCPNVGWGNLNVDPLFVNELAGDLRLMANSPARDYVLQGIPLGTLNDPNVCKPSWISSTTGYPLQLPSSRDHAENSRRIDATPSQTAGKLADLGALERVRWTLDVDGPFVMGQPITIEVPGPPGSALLMIGFESPSDQFVYSWGYLMITPQFLKLLATIPTNVPVPVGIPVDLGLEGLQGAVQCAVTLSGQPGQKQFTNVYRPRFRF